MSARCNNCGGTGGNMKKCTTCGMVWCSYPDCLKKKFGISPIAGNICPNCGGYNTVKQADSK